MNAEIICVGTELLLGDVVNTNASDIAHGLAKLGINVYYQAVVGDNPERLHGCLRESLSRCDIVFLTGGLGPTYDDLTKETAAACMGKQLVMNHRCLKEIESFFERTGRPMTDNNRKQAMLPEGCIVLPNPKGTAPGCIMEHEGKTMVLMPGPPREMRPMFEGPVWDYLNRRSDSMLISRVINLFGVGESAVEDRLREVMRSSTNPTIAPYVKTAELQLRVTARAKTRQEGEMLIAPMLRQISAIFPDNVYGFDYQNIQTAVVQILAERHLTLATAESCTGGLVADRIVEIPGASGVLLCGIVAYANSVKEQILGVTRHTLDEQGAVSRACALEMARGVRKISGADIGVSTTGIAGPAGGTMEKPVGLVFVAVVSEHGEEVRELHLARGRDDDRETIRSTAASYALDMVIRMTKEMSC